ncbi:anthranilate synthase component II [uncultured Fibrella sp.]|uniref:anthranilate synthase component II n=1 Tax=uncultured Fibrella sp. TaxID=1284596 RepID=UPI0035CC4468
MKILVLDNYDSFTYNLVYILRELGHRPDVIRNDKITVEETGKYDKILLSPGPGIPDEAGILKPLIAEYSATKSIMGVCLGHQAIGEVFGATLENLGDVLHGVAHSAYVLDRDEALFKQLPDDMTVGRYHSWSVVRDSLPEELLVTAEDEDGRVMGLRHARYDVRGVQFHPESVLTVGGVQMMKNWLGN